MNRARDGGSHPYAYPTLLAATPMQARRVWPADTAEGHRPILADYTKDISASEIEVSLAPGFYVATVAIPHRVRA